MAQLHILLVFSGPKEGREADYDRWYSDEHLGHVLDVPGFSTAQRFSQLVDDAIGAPSPHPCLTIYEIESDNLDAPMHEMHLRATGQKPGMPLTDAAHPSYASWVYSAEEGAARSEADPDSQVILQLCETPCANLAGALEHGVLEVTTCHLAAVQTVQLEGRERRASPFCGLRIFRVEQDIECIAKALSTSAQEATFWLYRPITTRVSLSITSQLS